MQRLQLSLTMTNELFLAQFKQWIAEMRKLAGERPGTGACTLASAMQLWLWTFNYVQTAVDADGTKLFHKTRQGVTFPLTDALCWLLAARQFILDVAELEQNGAGNPALAEGLSGTVDFFNDLAHVQCARAAGEISRITAELVFGYKRIPQGTRRAATPATAPRSWNHLKASFPAWKIRPAPFPTWPKSARNIRAKPVHA